MNLATRRDSRPGGAEWNGARRGEQSDRPALSVRRLVVTNFRNYDRAEISPGPAPVVLTGPNGAGKTNLLEAVSYLAPGRGLRGARLATVARAGSDQGWAVAASVAGPAGVVDINTGIAAREGVANGDGLADPRERRTVRIDGSKTSGPGALAGLVRIIWLTPRMDRMFSEAAAERRRFLDRLTMGLDPGHGRHVAAYERATRERLALLSRGGADRSWLAALESSIAGHGLAIAAARCDTVARLRGALTAGIGSFPKTELSVSGVLEDRLSETPALEAEEAFRERLAELRTRDAEAGRATEGPHRSDMIVRHSATGLLARQCSTGEQKGLVIAIVLASARLQTAMSGSAPLLLLDEITAHLDDRHRRALFAELARLGAQAWLTGTDAGLFRELDGDARFFNIHDGVVSEA